MQPSNAVHPSVDLSDHSPANLSTDLPADLPANISLSDATPGQYWQWRDQFIYFVHAGQRREQVPALLLIHGFGASTDHWRKNIESLQQDFDVWAIDLLGFGRSAKPAWTYSTDLWRSQIHEFIQTQIQTSVILAGNSLGGYVALSVGAAAPALVKGIVLLNTAGRFSDSLTPSVPPNLLQAWVMKGMQGLIKQPWANFWLFQYLRQRSVIRKTLQKVYVDQSAVTDRLVEEIYQPSCDAGAAQVFASVFTTPQGQNVDELLPALDCPLLLLWGEADPWMNSVQRGALFRKHASRWTEHFLQAGHCPHDEVPDQVNALIRGWIRDIVLMR